MNSIQSGCFLIISFMAGFVVVFCMDKISEKFKSLKKQPQKVLSPQQPPQVELCNRCGKVKEINKWTISTKSSEARSYNTCISCGEEIIELVAGEFMYFERKQNEAE